MRIRPRHPLDILIEDAIDAENVFDSRKLNGKRIFISGATGLIGMHLLANLYVLKKFIGYDLDVFGQYHNEPSFYTKELASMAGFKLYHSSYAAPLSDIIIHCAGYGQPTVFMNKPAETIHVNTTVTQRLLNSLNEGGTFVFVSSNEVYHGLQKEFAIEEDIGTTTPYHPRSGYIEGKRSGEAITYAYRKNGINAMSARLNLTYGPGARINDKRALSGFIDQAIKDSHIDMKFSGKELRTCSYARDVATMLLKVALHGKKPVYNIGEKSTTTIAEIASIVAKLTGATINIPKEDVELPGSHALPRMNVSLAENDLGKTDFITLEKGLEKTIEWHRSLQEGRYETL